MAMKEKKKLSTSVHQTEDKTIKKNHPIKTGGLFFKALLLHQKLHPNFYYQVKPEFFSVCSLDGFP